MAWYTIFLNPDIERNDVAIDRTRVFYDIEEMLSQVRSSVDFYLNLHPEQADLGEEESDKTFDVNRSLGSFKSDCEIEQNRT